MRTSYILKGATLLLSTLCACTSELEPSLLVESGEINKITVTMPDSPLDARTLISVGNTVTYAWASGDTIGIFPDKGYQVAFDMSSAEGDTYATFTGGGWALKGNSKYAAYYPFEYNNRQSSRIPITYEGQKQTGNKNTDKAGKFNYMVAKANTPDTGSVNFEMQRLGRFIILKFNVPEPTTLESVKLVATEEVFTLNGYVDLWAETPKIVSTEKSNSLSIKLEELTTTKENEEVTVYFFMEPVDLSGKKLSVEIKSEDGTLSFMEVDGKDMRANKAFALTAHQEGSYDNGVVCITKAGSMKELIGDDYLNIKTLKVIGPINGDDIYYLRAMLGAKDIDEAERGQLTTLDLSGATIRGGGRNPYVEYDSETGMSTGYPVNHNAISGRMFYQCLNLKNVILPNNINSILPNSFEGCEKLSSIVIPDGVTNISEYTFKNCTSLSSVSLPSVFYTIGVSAFEGCSSLVSITIPESITKIGGFAFYQCI